MHKTIEGTYENGRITLHGKPSVKKAMVEVTFLDETIDLKLFTRMPAVFLRPVKVRRIQRFSREELHER